MVGAVELAVYVSRCERRLVCNNSVFLRRPGFRVLQPVE